MILTDTHTHLYSSEFSDSVEDLIKRAGDQHVSRFFLPNIDKDTFGLVLDLQKKFPNYCFAMLGLHPVHVRDDYLDQIKILKKVSINNPFFAIGEIGLDFYWDKSFAKQQKDAFKIQCEWASEIDFPISIHCRNAFPEILDLLGSLKSLSLRGIFHCFTGTEVEASQIIEMGFYLGVGGVITYKNSTLKEVLRNIDLKHIVLETDSPYLPPVPYRGKTNESAYLFNIAEFLAQVKNCSLEELAEITTRNSIKIFRT
jgi:TatD DNase family protein